MGIDIRKINDMDTECIDLCEAMNQFPGITTIESCCGHGKNPYRIWFTVQKLKILPRLLYWFDGCHCGFYGWLCTASTDCAYSPVHFCIVGPTGKYAYCEAKEIATYLKQELKG